MVITTRPVCQPPQFHSHGHGHLTDLFSTNGQGDCSSPSAAKGHPRTRLVGLAATFSSPQCGSPTSRLPYCVCCHHRNRRHHPCRSRRRKTAAVLHPATKDQDDRVKSTTRLPDPPHIPSPWPPPFSKLRGFKIREASRTPPSIAKKVNRVLRDR